MKTSPVAAAACVLACVTAFARSTGSAAVKEGATRTPAAGKTQILWDRYGVPHIFATKVPVLIVRPSELLAAVRGVR
jgi:acyl-homoserine lactone acylase PvdQ